LSANKKSHPKKRRQKERSGVGKEGIYQGEPEAKETAADRGRPQRPYEGEAGPSRSGMNAKKKELGKTNGFDGARGDRADQKKRLD